MGKATFAAKVAVAVLDGVRTKPCLGEVWRLSQLLRAMSEGTAVTTGALAQLKELAHYGLLVCSQSLHFHVGIAVAGRPCRGHDG